MSKARSRHAAAIEASLERFAEVCDDPVALVYDRLFEASPEMKVLFWRDSNGAIKGEMLSRVFAALLDFVGERKYADNMIASEIFVHEGYDVPRGIFSTFFGVVADSVKAALGEDWTQDLAEAWRELLAEIDAYIAAVPSYTASSGAAA